MQLAENFPIEANIHLIVASPMRRAIYTAIETFRTFLPDDHGRDIIALPLLQETTDFRCDIGSPSKDLQAEVEGSKLPVDLSLVGENWIVKKSGKYEPIFSKLRDRVQEARCWLRMRPEKEIAVVTSGSFLHVLTNDWEDSNIYQETRSGTGWANAECRIYEFNLEVEKSNNMQNASMQETMESRSRRGVFNPPLAPDCQKELSRTTLQSWANQGYTLNSTQ
ncbi:phosphoglycerate mutase-like protein [Penicillium citrinum]|uniref:Phosphoglycerate mutase-like protein n=1 Tax=Penicillium citrinum TaxID=5077 RepID=A0A9W9PAY3_PENCI|nr:phosphoglycerate mutase-like protein [Penicillium citrinum]KAJ5241186.1 phosphoglycerate mutase-like protein [Penicillium citrinum]